MAEREYYILSLKYSRDCDNLFWWGPNNSGYTTLLNEAGKYSHEEVLKKASYYNNMTSTMAIPCEEVDAVCKRVVLLDHLHKLPGCDKLYKTEDGLMTVQEYERRKAEEKAKHVHEFIDDECECGETDD